MKLGILFVLLSIATAGCMKVKVAALPEAPAALPVIEEVSEAEMAAISKDGENPADAFVPEDAEQEKIKLEEVSPEGILASLREKILKEIQQVEPKQNPLIQPASPFQNNTELNHILRQFQKGIQLLENGKTEEGRFAFEALRDLYPDVSVFHINLGIAYKRLNRLSEAIDAYRRAIRLQGAYPEAYYNLAIILKDLGAFAEAEAAYLKAIALSPNFLDAHYNLAVLYDLYLDRAGAALRHYKRYTELAKETNEEMLIWMASLEKRMAARSNAK